MEALLLGIYSFFVWLIFIKFKWLPWNTAWQVTVVIIPIVALTAMILLLNIFAPSSNDVRVVRYVVPIVSQVRGRVIEVPIEEGNRPVKKGDVLFRVDPKPYELEVANLEAQLSTTSASQRELEANLRSARAKRAEAKSAIAAAEARSGEVSARLELARKRVVQYRDLASTGAGNRFDLEKAEADLKEMEGQYASARANEAQANASEASAIAGEEQVMQKLGAQSGGEFAQVAQIRAKLDNARWELDQTVTRSPCDCFVVNLQLRPGGFVAAFPLNPVITLVEANGPIGALYHQNELHQVQPGDEAEFTLRTDPGRIIKATVDSIVWIQGAGQQAVTGQLPQTGVVAPPPNRFFVKFNVQERDRERFLAAGAAGDAAIYTQHGEMIHIVRKVILRVGSYTNYLILKLH
jgi:multidrug resistance efflux pump